MLRRSVNELVDQGIYPRKCNPSFLGYPVSFMLLLLNLAEPHSGDDIFLCGFDHRHLSRVHTGKQLGLKT